MPRRNGPQERPSGFDSLRDRLPRSIAARLARAGLMPAAGAPTRQSEPPLAGDGHPRDHHPSTSPGTLDR